MGVTALAGWRAALPARGAETRHALHHRPASASEPAARTLASPPRRPAPYHRLQLLLDCQQLLDLDPQCMHSYVWAAQLLLYARWPLDARRVRGLFEEGLRRGRQAQCECRRLGGAWLWGCLLERPPQAGGRRVEGVLLRVGLLGGRPQQAQRDLRGPREPAVACLPALPCCRARSI